MADPVVCGFLTKVLCSRGGCVEAREILQHVALSEQQLRQTLEDAGQERFVLRREGGSSWVLAVSPVRLCIRKTCGGGGCDRLHLCKSNLMGRCRYGKPRLLANDKGDCGPDPVHPMNVNGWDRIEGREKQLRVSLCCKMQRKWRKMLQFCLSDKRKRPFFNK